MRSKAYRRHQHRRVKARVRAWWWRDLSTLDSLGCRERSYPAYVTVGVPMTHTVAALTGQLATTPKLCSCAMCGNPRHFYGGSSISDKRRAPVEGAE